MGYDWGNVISAVGDQGVPDAPSQNNAYITFLRLSLDKQEEAAPMLYSAWKNGGDPIPGLLPAIKNELTNPSDSGSKREAEAEAILKGNVLTPLIIQLAKHNDQYGLDRLHNTIGQHADIALDFGTALFAVMVLEFATGPSLVKLYEDVLRNNIRYGFPGCARALGFNKAADSGKFGGVPAANPDMRIPCRIFAKSDYWGADHSDSLSRW
ncbi:hypothetical protein H4R33_004391 [Dimargaris cristalligena]|nr:hypothetical protein H4R33_004391 [Dimargaris cristalligena]